MPDSETARMVRTLSAAGGVSDGAPRGAVAGPQAFARSGALVQSAPCEGADSGLRCRYDRLAAWLHWAVGVLLLAEIAFGLLLDEVAPRGTPMRAGMINLHKSIGILLGLLIVFRIGWRLAHAAPPWPQSMSALRRRAAKAGHAALYACMLVSPLTGYLGSNLSKHGVRFFGAELAPWGPDWPEAYRALVRIHDASSDLLLALALGHIAFAIWHAFVERDGIFDRIRPSRTRSG